MPYIKSKDDRLWMDIIIREHKEVLLPNGNLNYFLFALCTRTIRPSYSNYKNFRAELLECANMVWWKYMVPYEAIKEEQNGGIK